MKTYTSEEQAEINMISNESGAYIRYFTKAGECYGYSWKKLIQMYVDNDGENYPHSIDEIQSLFDGRPRHTENPLRLATRISSWVEDDVSKLNDDY